MQTVVIVIHLMLVIALIGVVLLQKSEGGGLGMGSSGNFLSSRGTTNVLTRTTALLAAGFFATSLVLSILAGMHRSGGSILGGATPSAPTAPSTPGKPPAGGVLDQLKKMEKKAPTPQPPQSK
jgi:preprotein translocase subunit SecG